MIAHIIALPSLNGRQDNDFTETFIANKYKALTKPKQKEKKVLTEYKMSKVLKSRNDIILEKENTHLWKNSNKQLAQLTLDFRLKHQNLRTIIIGMYANM